jgi:hypothetical protein
MDMLTMINGCDDAKALRSLLKNPLFSGVKPHIEARIAMVTEKPTWKPKLQISEKGRLILPKAVAKDGVAALRALLDQYEAHPNAKNYAEGG